MQIEIHNGRVLLGKTMGWLIEKTGFAEWRLYDIEALHHPFRRGMKLSTFGDECSAAVLRVLEAEHKRQCDEVGVKVSKLVADGHYIELSPIVPTRALSAAVRYQATIRVANDNASATYTGKGGTALAALVNAECARAMRPASDDPEVAIDDNAQQKEVA